MPTLNRSTFFSLCQHSNFVSRFGRVVKAMVSSTIVRLYAWVRIPQAAHFFSSFLLDPRRTDRRSASLAWRGVCGRARVSGMLRSFMRGRARLLGLVRARGVSFFSRASVVRPSADRARASVVVAAARSVPGLQFRSWSSRAPWVCAGALRRRFATASSSTVGESEYSRVADDLLDSLVDTLDDDALPFEDVEFSSGVISVVTGTGVWIINKHSASRQVWLSSPRSGPSKYEFDPSSGTWRSEREDRRRLRDLLTEEFREVVGSDFAFEDDF